MAETCNLKDIFTECIPLFIALGDPTRLNIIQCLYEVMPQARNEMYPV